MYMISTAELLDTAKFIHKAVIEEAKQETVTVELYREVLLAYEFFRLLRGEGFISIIEHDSNTQKILYQMENEILEQL